MKKEIKGYNVKDQQCKIYARKIILCCDYIDENSIASDELKKAGVLDLWFEPVYKEETTLQVGKWYKDDGFLVCFQGYESNESFGFDPAVGWMYDWTITRNWDALKPATDKEVEEALIKEAKKRGYKKGNFKCLNNNGQTECDEINPKWFYDGNFGVFCANQWLFLNGKWAEIIEEPEFTKEELKLIAKILKKIC